jgi:hypothetical protein
MTQTKSIPLKRPPRDPADVFRNPPRVAVKTTTVPDSRTGYTIVRCLPALEGKPWNALTSAFVRALRPSEVVVLDADVSAKCDARLWRVFVRLTKVGLIHSIEQEVLVDLPDGVENGYALVQAVNRPAHEPDGKRRDDVTR